MTSRYQVDRFDQVKLATKKIQSGNFSLQSRLSTPSIDRSRVLSPVGTFPLSVLQSHLSVTLRRSIQALVEVPYTITPKRLFFHWLAECVDRRSLLDLCDCIAGYSRHRGCSVRTVDRGYYLTQAHFVLRNRRSRFFFLMSTGQVFWIFTKYPQDITTDIPYLLMKIGGMVGTTT